MTDFTHVRQWVFDLDNTLYPAHCNLFFQIDQRMAQFIEEKLSLPKQEARLLQKELYRVHGTTLSGLMKDHDVKPHDFMDFVHDIDLSNIGINHDLRAALHRLPGEKFIFTNGSVKHAENVAGKIGVIDLFDGVFDIQAANYVPKPQKSTYDIFFERFSIRHKNAAMFEDMAENLVAPHKAGLTTVLVQSEADWVADEPADKRPSRPGETFDHVHHTTDDLTDFLTGLKTAC